MIFYMPSWHGDFRLEERGKGCVLKVVDPTPGEIEIIGKFFAYGRKKGWVEEITTKADHPYRDKNEYVIKASLEKVADVLVKLTKPSKAALTAVSFSDGKIEKHLGVPGTGQALESIPITGIIQPRRTCNYEIQAYVFWGFGKWLDLGRTKAPRTRPSQRPCAQASSANLSFVRIVGNAESCKGSTRITRARSM